jgi:hypothetical protein
MEQGTHNDLLKVGGGIYAGMWAAQESKSEEGTSPSSSTSSDDLHAHKKKEEKTAIGNCHTPFHHHHRLSLCTPLLITMTDRYNGVAVLWTNNSE